MSDGGGGGSQCPTGGGGDRNIRIIDADSSFGGAAGGAGLRVRGALAPPGPPLEPPLIRR